MATGLSDLPPELVLNVLSLLRLGDLAQLISVCKYFHTVVEPLIWHDIELHAPAFHDEQDRKVHQNPDLLRVRRSCPLIGRWGDDEEKCENTSTAFFKTFENRFTVEGRREMAPAGARIRSLCAPLQPYASDRHADDYVERDCWNVFPFFTNLQRLELTVLWTSYNSIHPVVRSARPLTELRLVKIYGYIPRDLIHYILHSSISIERLELGLLDAPIDNTQLSERLNPPRSIDQDSADEAVESGSYHPNPRNYQEDSDAQAQEADYRIGFDGSESEDIDDEHVAPRPLSWVPARLPYFPRLTHLHLCKPSQVADLDQSRWPFEVLHDLPLELQCLTEWAHLLENVHHTLEHLVLEHRPVVPEIEVDRTGCAEFMRDFSEGPGEERFVKAIVPVLKAQAFPRLKSVHLYGILVSSKARQDLKQLFFDTCAEKDVKCEFRLGARSVLDRDKGVVSQGCDGMRGDFESEGNEISADELRNLKVVTDPEVSVGKQGGTAV